MVLEQRTLIASKICLIGFTLDVSQIKEFTRVSAPLETKSLDAALTDSSRSGR